ncbi:Indigoidine synthase A family protein [Phytophthora palmivora]|uniref:Indigoidine synthase A family protein n=1 Tax=Phytophthora palmivora TaxID=4796 RepID=A0A2P4X0I5_9STRA|nr:Indigoidine synthase A family protein [Phytophthora palmivora]
MWRRSGSALSQRLALSEEVSEALYGRVKKPVVALESTIISHGMPFPQNLQMAKHVEELVRAHGACPATVCIADGALKVGLAEQDLTQLAELGAGAKKCSTRDIAAAITDKKVVGATTVSSTMRIAHAAGIKVFVTGGIGGVHRFCEETMDISTDLMELSRTPVAVVCAGVKSILDIPRTLEFLETHSVPVIGYKTDQFPAFFTQDSGEKAHLRRDTPDDVARLIYESEALELPNGHIIAVPNPKPVPTALINEAIELGLKEVVENNIHGQAVTPYLLKRVNEMTQGVSLESNIDLVNNNATVGRVPQWIPLRNRMLSILCRKSIACCILGVGRNIAECLHRLRLDPLFVSSVGNDASGTILLENLKKVGMDTSGINISDNLSTAVYSALLDSTGDMDAAIADMSAFDSIVSGLFLEKSVLSC